VDPFQTHYFSENLIAPGIEPGSQGYVARNSDHLTREAVRQGQKVRNGFEHNCEMPVTFFKHRLLERVSTCYEALKVKACGMIIR
jgi:hypothetical protein